MSRIEDFFNLPKEEKSDIAVSYETVMEKSIEVIENMSLNDKLNNALLPVNELETHDKEMDDIANTAKTTFDDLMELGKHMPDQHAGKVFETAGTMLDIALRAKDSKTNRKLKMLELQLKKYKIDKDEDTENNNKNNGLDRNEILALMKNKNIIDVPTK